jgi:hypothetical protein
MQKRMTRKEKEAAGLTKPVQSKYELKRAAARLGKPKSEANARQS